MAQIILLLVWGSIIVGYSCWHPPSLYSLNWEKLLQKVVPHIKNIYHSLVRGSIIVSYSCWQPPSLPLWLHLLLSSPELSVCSTHSWDEFVLEISLSLGIRGVVRPKRTDSKTHLLLVNFWCATGDGLWAIGGSNGQWEIGHGNRQ